MATIILGIIVGIILFFIKWRNDKKLHSNDVQSDFSINSEEAKNFVEKLYQLGYFKYVDSIQIEDLKKEFIQHYDPKFAGGIITTFEDETGLPKDYRLYFCDGEDIFEEGGVKNLLKELQPTFTKIGLKLEINNQQESINSLNQLNHDITINNTEYVIFKNFEGIGWIEAPQRISEIINSELEKQNINEKIYLISDGNDGMLIFLSSEQYKFLSEGVIRNDWFPLNPKEWAGKNYYTPLIQK